MITLIQFLDNDGIVHCQFEYVMTIGSDWWNMIPLTYLKQFPLYKASSISLF